MGGLAGADAICQAHADAALLGGTWTAWLSDSTTDAKDRIVDAEYRLVDSTTIVDISLAALTDGSIMNAINFNEWGVIPPGNTVWTGTNTNGTKETSEGTCSSWTSSSSGVTGGHGRKAFTGSAWTDQATGPPNLPCSANSARLYCFDRLSCWDANSDNVCGACEVPAGCDLVVDSGRQYAFCPTSVSWDAARASCEAVGMDLVSIHSGATNAFLRSTSNGLGRTGPFWIGLNDVASEGTFVWTSGEPFDYSNWALGEPNSGPGENAVELLGSGTWNDAIPAGVKPYVCERPDAGCEDTNGDGLCTSADCS